MNADLILNAEAERAVLASILIDPNTLPPMATKLVPEHFGNAANRVIFRAMLRLFEGGRPIDALAVIDAANDPTLQPSTVAELFDASPAAKNLDGWSDLILERAKRRAAFRLAERLMAQARDEGAEIDRTLDGHMAAMSKLLEDGRGSISIMREIVPGALKRLDEFLSKADGIIGVPTGIEPLDKCTSGLRRGSLWVLAARPGRGKSTLCAQAALFAGLAGFKSLVFSMEMPPVDVVERLLLSEAGVNKWRLRYATSDADSWAKINCACEKISGVPVWFDRRESPTLAQIRASARQQQGGVGLDLIVIDHALRIARDPKLDNWLAIGALIQGLKSLALGLNVPVLVAYQLMVSEDEKRPSAKDLAQSKQVIESECDVLGFLHPDKPDWRKSDPSDFWLYIDKHRAGYSSDIALSFDRAGGRFHSREQQEQAAW